MTYLLFILGSFIVRFSLLMTSFQSVFRSVFVFPSRVALHQIFAFYLCLLVFTFAFLSPYSACPFLLSCAFFSTRFTPFTSFFFSVAVSLSFQLIFTQNPSAMSLNYNNFLPLSKFLLCWYCCFATWLENAKY